MVIFAHNQSRDLSPTHKANLPPSSELHTPGAFSLWLQRTQAFALFAFAAFVCFSIAGSHISLGLLSLCVILQLFGSRAFETRFNIPPLRGVRGVFLRTMRFVNPRLDTLSSTSPSAAEAINTPPAPLKGGIAKTAFAIGFEWPLAAFVIVCVISTILSDQPWDSFRNLKNLLTILGAYTVAYSLRTHPAWRKPALWIFIISATGAALWGLLEFALGLSPKVMSTQSTTMTWGAMSAMFILITLFAATRWPTSRERWAARVFFMPQLAALFFSLVRGAYLGFIAGALYLFHRYWKRLLPAALVLILVGVLFAPALLKERVASMIDLQHPTILVRLHQWQIAARIIVDHPLFGVGWHDLAGLTRQYAQPDPNLPAEVNHDIFNIGHYHSTYFTLATCGGLLGLAAFVWLMIAVWRSLGKVMSQIPENFSEEHCGQRAIPPLRGVRGVFFDTKKIFKTQKKSIHTSFENRQLVFACRAAFLSFLVTGLFDWTFGDAEVVTMFWFVVGLGMGQGDEQPIVARVSDRQAGFAQPA